MIQSVPKRYQVIFGMLLASIGICVLTTDEPRAGPRIDWARGRSESKVSMGSANDCGLPFWEKRVALKARQPAWFTLDTERYLFLMEIEPGSSSIELARDLELVQSHVYQSLFAPSSKVEELFVVRILSSAESYLANGGPVGSAGYWSRDANELVLFDEGNDSSTRSVLFHEAFHQYMDSLNQREDYLPWFSEGHGDFFAGMKLDEQGVVFEMFEWRVDFLNDWMEQERPLVPLEKLVAMQHRDYYVDAQLKYAEGWALIYFLRCVTQSPRLKQIPRLYFQNSRREDAVEIAFSGVDFLALERDLRTWILSLSDR